MTDTSQYSDQELPHLTRDQANAALAFLSERIGASLQFDEHNSVGLSYYNDGEATLTFLESLGVLILTAPIANPAEIELLRLRELLEFNMEWRRPGVIIVPDNNTRAHLTMALPVEPNDPASLETMIVQAVGLAGETSCAATSLNVPEANMIAAVEIA